MKAKTCKVAVVPMNKEAVDHARKKLEQQAQVERLMLQALVSAEDLDKYLKLLHKDPCKRLFWEAVDKNLGATFHLSLEMPEFEDGEDFYPENFVLGTYMKYSDFTIVLRNLAEMVGDLKDRYEERVAEAALQDAAVAKAKATFTEKELKALKSVSYRL